MWQHETSLLCIHKTDFKFSVRQQLHQMWQHNLTSWLVYPHKGSSNKCQITVAAEVGQFRLVALQHLHSWFLYTLLVCADNLIVKWEVELHFLQSLKIHIQQCYLQHNHCHQQSYMSLSFPVSFLTLLFQAVVQDIFTPFKQGNENAPSTGASTANIPLW